MGEDMIFKATRLHTAEQEWMHSAVKGELTEKIVSRPRSTNS